jgi:hypothetical protein
VPEIAPAADSVSPAGSEPALIDQVSEEPPDACSCAE